MTLDRNGDGGVQPLASLMIELLRFGDPSGALRKGDRYLVTRRRTPVREYAMTMNQADAIPHLSALRSSCKPDIDIAANPLAALVTNILESDKLPFDRPTQVDLVVNSAELSALPFELALDREGKPLFVRRETPVILTRRVRLELDDEPRRWPLKPRVLFIWASPPEAGKTVPHADHLRELHAALAPWIGPPEHSSADAAAPFLTVIEQATLQRVQEACVAAAAEGRPYTHVHVLAHGDSIGDEGLKTYGVSLHCQGGEELRDVVSDERFADALRPIFGSLAMVTLAVCDGGSVTNTILPGRSIAHRLHDSGVPVVAAAQFPLTFPGSVILVRELYAPVLRGEDVRWAIHAARCSLYAHPETMNDWAGLVAYVRFSEKYDEQLLDVKLATELEAMKTAQRYSDRVLENPSAQADFDEASGRLIKCIDALVVTFAILREADRKGALGENAGLLGSAHKRLAELYFRRSQLTSEAGDRRAMREALERSHHYYLLGFEHTQARHWNGIQALALEVVLTGKMEEGWRWHSVLDAAKKIRDDPDAPLKDKVWAHGTIAELALLGRFAGNQAASSMAEDALRELKNGVEASDPFPIQSTQMQLGRYVTWWTKQHGLFGHEDDLASEARELVKVLTAEKAQA